MKKITIILHDGSEYQHIPTLVRPGRLWWILPDDMRTPPRVRDAVPMTCQLRPETRIPFVPKLQFDIRGLNDSGNKARDDAAFEQYRDTWNTASGKLATHYNAITDVGDRTNLPALECHIQFAGNIVWAEPEISDGTIGIPRGVRVIRIHTIHPDDLHPEYTDKTHPWFVHHQVIIRPNLFGEFQMRNTFIQMGGKSKEPFRPCLTKLISPVDLFIRQDEVREVLENEPIPNPYNPVWDYTTRSLYGLHTG